MQSSSVPASATGPAYAEGLARIYRELTDSGVDFVHHNGASGNYFLPEITCGAGALFDYDNDGDLDLYLVQGAPLGAAAASPRTPPDGDGALALSDRLYRNDLAAAPNGGLELRFVDVTTQSGIEMTDYGCGASAGDFDNDGWIDLYITGLGANHLLKNRGDGSFAPAPAEATLSDTRWSVPATWLDFDRDGWLDLFVGNYLEFSYTDQKICRTSAGARDYCNPAAFEGVPDSLFRNQGDGTFVDVSQSSGIAKMNSKSLGVSVADFNLDGRPDLYVTNDGVPNQLWIQLADGTFSEEALLAGCAVNAKGVSEASMGVDAADFDGDGDEDLFMSHLSGETNTLFLNDGYGNFDDRTVALGLSAPSWPFTSWGTGWLDFDNDGLLDLVAVNGAVRAVESLINAGDPYPFHQPNQLFHNSGNSRFAEVSAEAGPAFARSEVSRGLLFGDLDNDGDEDLVIINANGPARVLLNQMGAKNAWLGLDVILTENKRHDLGARAELVSNETHSSWRRVKTDGGYGASNDPRVLFGLAAADKPQTIRVHELDGRVAAWWALPVRHHTTLYRPSYWRQD